MEKVQSQNTHLVEVSDDENKCKVVAVNKQKVGINKTARVEVMPMTLFLKDCATHLDCINAL